MTPDTGKEQTMPVYKKPSHGKIHIYGGQGKNQPYIGPLDDPKKWDVKIARETQEKDDKKFDKQLEKYLENVLLLSLYMSDSERREYLSKRYKELLAHLRSLNLKKK